MFGVFIGGGIGTLLRSLICARINSHYGTMLVNVTGAFLIGVLYEYFRSKSNASPEIRLFLMTGLLGGFTTFSTYLLDFMVLFELRKSPEAFLYLFFSIGLGIVAVLAGMKITTAFVN